MIPNIEKLQQLVDKKFNGNKSAFAKAIGIERSHISHILKDGTGAGAMFFGALMQYCEKENLKFKDYIFLPTNVNKINDRNQGNNHTA